MKKHTILPDPYRRASIRRVTGLSLAILVGALSLASSSPLVAKTWKVGDGNWNEPDSWLGGVPTNEGGTTNQAEFPYIVLHPSLSVNVDTDAMATLLLVSQGQSVDLNIEDGCSLTLGSISRVGQTSTSGSGPAILTVNGPASGTGTLKLNQLFVQNNSSAIFSGSNLKVTASSSIILGNLGNDNTLRVTGGADVAVTAIYLGHASNGESTKGNQLKLEANSTLKTTASAGLTIGSGATHHSNSVTVSGQSAVLEMQGGSLNIGNSDASNRGGNFLEVAQGGQVKTDRATQIYGFTIDSGSDHGANRLTIAAGGIFTSSSSITNRGLLQLADGGVLEGKTLGGASANLTITIANGGRFEAAGNGLGNTVTTNVSSGGHFAVGLKGATTASQLKLGSQINFSANSSLEFSIFEDGTVDTIHLMEGSSLTGTVNLVLHHNDSVAGSWVVFTGDTTGVDVTFDLSALNPAIWDTSQFNQAGGWQLKAIPEPSSIVLLTTAGFCLVAYLNYCGHSARHTNSPSLR